MTKPLTVEECKRMLFKLALKHGIAPKIISSRLLSAADKDDMLGGYIPFETVDCFIESWKQTGMGDYANGNMSIYPRYREHIAQG